MSIGAPTFQIQCDEAGCGDSITLFCSDTPYPGVYSMRDVTATYEFWGGETLPDGKHRCKSCRAKIGKIPDRSPAEIQQLVERGYGAERAITPVVGIIEAAATYRTAEQDGTPRMWRGKTLQDLASRLDDALEIVYPVSSSA